MCGFTLKSTNLLQAKQLILEKVPEFENAPEYQQLDEDDNLVAGLVCAAFTKFLERRLEEGPKESNSVSDACFEAIEVLASNPSQDIQNLIVTEIFENIHDEEIVIRRLLPISKALYDQWLS